jgi:uncharacterized DUF497 family protein
MPDSFDWDEGNWPKCAKHGLAKEDIESAFSGSPRIFPARSSSGDEQRHFAVGSNAGGRYVFVVFTSRNKDGAALIRPISARFMHEKEVRNYERQTQDFPETED